MATKFPKINILPCRMIGWVLYWLTEYYTGSHKLDFIWSKNSLTLDNSLIKCHYMYHVHTICLFTPNQCSLNGYLGVGETINTINKAYMQRWQISSILHLLHVFLASVHAVWPLNVSCTTEIRVMWFETSFITGSLVGNSDILTCILLSLWLFSVVSTELSRRNNVCSMHSEEKR